MTKRLSVCVLGGGTAGSMAVAHIGRKFPNVELKHIFDSRIPAIGVGEGTTPPFRDWLHDITGLTFEELQEQALITVKEGIRFENWGHSHTTYHHLFAGSEGYAYHISADRIGELLRDRSTARVEDRRVVDVVSDNNRALIRFEDDSEAEFDLVIDARGFPATLDHGHNAFRMIPTNAALLQRCRTISDRPVTRAVARPHGWIFCIPLTAYTSCGYIFNASLDPPERITRDFERFLDEEKLECDFDPRLLPFPNFARKRIFDGAVFHIGNAASFLEPLEATAITVVLFQLKLISAWLVTRLTVWGDDDCAHILDRQCSDFIEQVGWFVGWHYARGSTHDTKFWRTARTSFERAADRAGGEPALVQFQHFADRGQTLSPALAMASSRDELQTLDAGSDLNETCGGFIVDSFAKVGHGIGYYR